MKWLKWMTGVLILIIIALAFLLIHVSGDLNKSHNDLVSARAQSQADLESSQKTYLAALSDSQLVESKLTTARGDLLNTLNALAATQSELDIYKSTYGSVVDSNVNPPYGTRSQIINNPAAVNPTWAQLENFLLTDTTDQNLFIAGAYECGDYARDVHDNAEKAGIRAAWVYIRFAEKTAHACDAFVTSDRGLIFVDSTRPESGGPPNCEKTVNLQLGQSYTPVSLISQPGWNSNWASMGTVLDVQIYW